MMTLGLGECANTIRKGQGLDKVPEAEYPLESLNVLALYQRPVRDFVPQLLLLRGSDLRRIAAACGALFVRE